MLARFKVLGWGKRRMRTALVAGNWKMNGTRASAQALLAALLTGLKANPTQAQVAVCPPFTLIPLVAEILADSTIGYGAQDIATEPSGAYTGEVSAEMLTDYGCRYAIVGHSERRALYGETDTLVAAKYTAARVGGLIPIACVGETLQEREAGQTEAVVARQLDALLALGMDALAAGVVAYEPVWAIGTGKTATPEQAQDVHRFIRARVAAHSAQVAEGLQLLYGGSVKGNNAAALFGQPDIDGGLIGGAALSATEFLQIIRAAG